MITRIAAILLITTLSLVLGTAEGQEKALLEEMFITLDGGLTMDFVLIPPGSFMMGSEKGFYDERPVHKVTITKPLCVGIYEVTQAQWKAVMGDNSSHFRGNDLPVENVSWQDCQQFLEKLKAKVGGGCREQGDFGTGNADCGLNGQRKDGNACTD